MQKSLIILSFLIIMAPTSSMAYTAVAKDFGVYGYDVELDPYYSSAEIYTSLYKKPRLRPDQDDEREIYRYLWQSAFKPSFLLFEVSCYPMPCIGVAIKKNFRGFYDSAAVSEDFNLIQVTCEGFEEPAAFSIFLGNLASFKPKDVQTDIKGKAYMGYLLSIGNYHIKESDLIEDNWLELEWKIKGDRITEHRIMKWSYRMGIKQHSNKEIKDLLYFSIFRDRVDFEKDLKNESIFNNVNFEYKLFIDYKNLSIIKHFFLIGKSFPYKDKKLAFQISFGFIWTQTDSYMGSLKRAEQDSSFEFMIRPNVKF